MRLVGILLVVVGVLLLVYGGVTLLIPQDVIDLNVLSITIREDLVIPLPPIVGLIFLILGVAMVAGAPAYGPPPPPPY